MIVEQLTFAPVAHVTMYFVIAAVSDFRNVWQMDILHSRELPQCNGGHPARKVTFGVTGPSVRFVPYTPFVHCTF